MRILPGDRMTWVMLSHAFTGIVAFVEMYAGVSMEIGILDEILGPVGTGSVSYRSAPSDIS